MTEPNLPSPAAEDSAPGSATRSAPASAPAPAPAMTPQQYGVGARFTLSVYDSDYVSIILGALAEADASGLTIETGDISTFVTGPEQRVLAYLRDVIAHAAGSGAHLSAAILLSRGCPGELQCELPPGVAALGADPVALAPTGVRARAHWSLYPLLDGGADGAAGGGADGHGPESGPEGGSEGSGSRELAGSGSTGSASGSSVSGDHMTPIYAAIERAKAEGVYSGSDHYATRLDGDLAAVLQTAANAWIGVGAAVQHVVTHLTVSINSPSQIRD